MKTKNNDLSDLLYASRLLTSQDVKSLLRIKSDTTLIKMEREGDIKISGRIGNQKRYRLKHIMKLMNRN